MRNMPWSTPATPCRSRRGWTSCRPRACRRRCSPSSPMSSSTAALKAGRDPAGARRHVRHRDNGDPDGQGGRRQGDRHRPAAPTRRGPGPGWAPMSPSTPRPRTSPRSAKAARAASTWCWTWSAATISTEGPGGAEHRRPDRVHRQPWPAAWSRCRSSGSCKSGRRHRLDAAAPRRRREGPAGRARSSGWSGRGSRRAQLKPMIDSHLPARRGRQGPRPPRRGRARRQGRAAGLIGTLRAPCRGAPQVHLAAVWELKHDHVVAAENYASLTR
jgi:hypothetical protein